MIILIIFLIVIALLFFAYPKIKKRHFKEIVEQEYYSKKYGRLLKFWLNNKSDKELELNLCELENCDDYTFINSDGNYKMLVSYLKSYNLNVVSTLVKYSHSNWQKDIVKLSIYNPFEQIKKPILVAMDDFNMGIAHKNMIESLDKYNFNYYSTLLVKLAPKENKEITLFVIEEEEENNQIPAKCGLVIKNNSNQVQNVKLFDKQYSNPDIDIQSLFDINTYESILNYFSQKSLLAREIRVFSKHKFFNYKINFDDYSLSSPYDAQENHYFIIDLKEEIFIAYFEVEIQPNTEIIITLK
jgi:hypothetical protein